MIAVQPGKARLETRLAERLDQKKESLDALRPLPTGMVKRLQEDLRVLLTYHSNAIEGNTLTLRETQMVIEHGITVGGKSLREHLEATNHAGAFSKLAELAQPDKPLTRQTVLDLHLLVMNQLEGRPGQFRQGQVYIRGASVNPPPAYQIEEYLAGWLKWLQPNGEGQHYEPVTRFAISHHDFEFIHPFEDGNGRTGRLLLNLMLMQAGYPPALILNDWRTAYIRALDQASSTGNYNQIVNLVGRAVEKGLDFYLEACSQVPEEVYQPLPALAPSSGYSVDYLGWLVRQGRIAGIKRGRYWFSTQAAITRYKSEVEKGTIPKGRPKSKLE